jgi:prepilin peptidase dependent protein B
MLIKIFSRQKGFSLIELMISLTLGLIVMGGALSMVTSILATNTSTLKMTRLNEELRAAMMMLTSDLRRAGSWGGVVNQVISGTPIINPFSQIFVSADGSCILYSYDYKNNNNPLDTNNQYGFRLDTKDGAVEMRQAGAGCEDTGWQNLTDENSIEITALNIESFSSSAGRVTVRQYRINLTGRLKNEPTVERTLQSTVKIRNNMVSAS